jgi:hypothetical protein
LMPRPFPRRIYSSHQVFTQYPLGCRFKEMLSEVVRICPLNVCREVL